jgi:glycosyltransferase 2 family protein
MKLKIYNFVKEWFPRIRKTLLRLGILIGIILLSIQIFKSIVDFKSQTLSIKHYWPLILALLIILIHLFQHIETWIILMRITNVKLPPHEARYGYALSFLARYIPGSIWGYLSRSEWLWQQYQVTYLSSNYISALEIVLSVASNLLATGLCFLFINSGNVSEVLSAILILGSVSMWYFLLARIPSFVKEESNRFPRSDGGWKRPSLLNWLRPLILLLICWFYDGFALLLIGAAFGVWEMGQWRLLWAPLTKAFSLSWLSGFLIFFLPSGLGVRELVLSSQLISTLQVDPAAANGISITMRLIMTLAEFVYLAIIVFIHFLKSKKGPTAVLPAEE